MKARYQFIVKPNSKGTLSIYLQVYMSREHRRNINTGIFVQKDQWDPNAGMPRTNTDDLRKVTKSLIALRRKIEDAETELMMQGDNLRPWHINTLLDDAKPKPSMLFMVFIENQIKDDTRLSHETKRSHRYTLQLIKDYRPEAMISQLNYEFVLGFDRFLNSRSLHPNTIEGHHRRCRKYCILAEKMGLLIKSPYRDFKMKKIPTLRQALTENELNRIAGMDYRANLRMHRIQQAFLFCCYTGLRYGEWSGLLPEHIVTSPEGYEITLHKVRKYPTPVFLPLGTLFSGKPNEIFIREYLSPTGLKMPKIHNTKINRGLKEIAYDAGINKTLTFHIARHTFATLLGAITGDAFLIKSLMGHQDIKTSMVYIKDTPEITRSKLRGVNWNVRTM